MNGNELILGIVENGTFRILDQVSGEYSGTADLTGIAMQESVPPETKKIDLTEYEGMAIMVHGHNGGGWIYSASIIDKAGPIVTALVQKVFLKKLI